MALNQRRSSAVIVHDTGLTLLTNPPDPIADIVFVHGLQGHPRRTWSCQTALATAPEIAGSATRKHSPFRDIRRIVSRTKTAKSEAISRPTSDVFWPADLLPQDCSNVRVFTWGYESSITRFFGEAANQNTIFAHARDLLYALGIERRDCRMRKLIFVVHSLGGIIIKDVLRRASEEQDQTLHDVFTSTRAVLFLGTPHRGSSMAETGELLRRLVSASGLSTSDRNLRALNINSSELEIIHEGFMKLYMRSPRPFEVSTFQEARGLAGTSYLGLGEKVVNDVSSSFTGTERCQTINTNHMNMCRFASRRDNGYLKVVGEISMYVSAMEALDRAKGKIESSPTASSSYSMNDIEKTCIRLFNASDISEYQADIPRFEVGTCQWILSNAGYLEWYYRDKPCLLWISGHPCSGKTILSTFLHAYLTANTSSSVAQNTVCIFFCDDKVEGQRDGKAVLRSLIYQILVRHRKLIRHIKAAYDIQGPRLIDNFNELWRIFKAVTTNSRAGFVSIIVDAIDECEEKSRHRLLEAIAAFMAELQSTTQITHPVKILITSRPLLLHRYQIGSVRIEDLDCNTEQDLQLFIKRKIEGIACRTNCEPESRKYLEDALLSKADHTFLWVKLILERLERSPIATQKDFQRMVEEMPKGLVATYERFLYDIPAEYEEIAKQLLHLIAGSKRSLSLDELRLLLALQTPQRSLATLTANLQPNIRETLEIILGGFVRILDDHVSFVHLSAKDFLNNLSKQTNHPLSSLYGIGASSSDELLAKACISYLMLDDFSRGIFDGPLYTKLSPVTEVSNTPEDVGYSFWDKLDLAEDTIFKSSQEALWTFCKSIAARYPLFDYAALHWTGHFQSCGTVCSSELQRLAIRLSDPTNRQHSNWFRYYWLHCESDDDIPTNFTTFTTGCYFGHFPTMQTLATNKPALHQDTISQGLYWASYRGHSILIPHLLDLGAKLNWRTTSQQTPLTAAASFDHLGAVEELLKSKETEVNYRGKGGRTALSMAAGNGHSAIVQSLMDYEGIEIDTPDASQWTPVFWALGSKYVEVVRMFIPDVRVDLNHIDNAGRSLLSWAAAAGEIEIVQLLLQQMEVDIQQRDFRGRTALSWAAGDGHLDTVMALRRSGRINVSSKDNDGRNAISWAASHGHHAVLQYLFKYDPKGADEGDKYGWTPIAWALDSASPDTVKTLLESGLVDPTKTDKSGRTLLSWAQSYGHEEIIKLIADAVKTGCGRTAG